MDLTDHDWQKITDAAMAMGLSKDSPRKWRASGEIPALRVADLHERTGIPIRKLHPRLAPKGKAA